MAEWQLPLLVKSTCQPVFLLLVITIHTLILILPTYMAFPGCAFHLHAYVVFYIAMSLNTVDPPLLATKKNTLDVRREVAC